MFKHLYFILSLVIVVIFFAFLPVLADMVMDTAWVRSYQGLEGYWAETNAIAVDNSGNIYVAGFSYGVGGYYGNYTTIKYFPTGETVWVRYYSNPNAAGSDEIKALRIDDSGNIYVTGRSWSGYATGDDYATVKYYPNGDTAWVRRYNGPENSQDETTALAVDNSGNVYVTGHIGNWPNFDYATIKYYSNGDLVWVQTYNGTGNNRDEAKAIAVDNSNNVYVTGFSTGIGTSRDYTTIKYDSSGNELWVQTYNGPVNGWDEAYDLAVDNSGNLYITGYICIFNDADYDYATIRYYPTGEIAWVQRYNGSANGWDVAYAIALDNSMKYLCDWGKSRG